MIVPGSTGRYLSFGESIRAVIADLPALAAIGLFSNVVILLNISAPSLILNSYVQPPTPGQFRNVILGPGFLALMLPGLLLTVLLAILVPVRIIEQTDFVQTFVRGTWLTKGNRWPIFGLMIGTIVLQVTGEAAVYLLIEERGLIAFLEEPPSNGAAAILGQTLVATAVSVLGATVTAVLYAELRRIKDGPAPRELALEFD